MKSISASYAKQNFGDALLMALDGPVSIEKHGKSVAILSGPSLFKEQDRVKLKKMARLQQKNIENERLIRHQKVAIRLLSDPDDVVVSLIEKAKDEVHRWKLLNSCSSDYIERWNSILQNSSREIAHLICSDLDGWGVALRQNSPWKMATYES